MGKLNVLEYVNMEFTKIKDYVEYSKKIMRDDFPELTVIQVGDSPASNRYVNNKLKKCNEFSIETNYHKLEEPNHLKDIMVLNNKIEMIVNNSKDNELIMIQKPLPRGVVDVNIDRLKDIDGTSDSTKKEMSISNNIVESYNNGDFYIPCTARGVLEYMRYLQKDLEGKSVLIINRSDLVGNPLREMLLQENMFVSVGHSHINKEKLISKFPQYDYIISGIGKYGFFTEKDIPSGCTFIDVGIDFKDGKMGGDLLVESESVDFDYTPVPNGVGRLTVLSLIKNILSYAII